MCSQATPAQLLTVLVGTLWACSAQTLVAQSTDAAGIGSAANSCTEIERQVPPVGLEIPTLQWSGWWSRVRSLEEDLQELDSEFKADVEMLLKACRYAVEFRELYQEKDFAKVDRLLDLAAERVQQLARGSADWTTAAGRQVRGFRSAVDGSVQPVGLVLPEKWQAQSELLPLYVWLHGRGDKSTDLHFLCERLDKDGQITPPGAIVLHPLGRQCIGYKSAGETDVMEAIDFVVANYPVDPRRIVLMGFSMGGAGVWHLAAHYGERFVAASAGAGFAETAQYQKLQPEDYPPEYEQVLWSIYDVPGYTRNLFNLPVVAYSGELDKQIQAAQVMEQAFADEGRTLTHLIGPGMGHKYHPESLQEILSRMAAAASRGLPEYPTEFYIQTKHPRYARRAWLTIDGPQTQYSDTRATAKLEKGAGWTIETKNARRLRIDNTALRATGANALRLDGQALKLDAGEKTLLQRDASGVWSVRQQFDETRKRPGLSGPIDDAFIDPFLVVLPSGTSPHAQVERWVKCELANFEQRWQTLFRGNLRMKLDDQVTPEDMAQYHLIVWGDPHSNSLIPRLWTKQEGASQPIQWTSDKLTVGEQEFDPSGHVPLAIRPNPLAPGRYVVLNSGPTFRQAHDRTNSLQNPHLPDWAIISLAEPPSAERPGRIAAAGFFDDAWQLDPKLTW